MDLSMPVMDGLTSTRHIRQFESKNGLPKSHIVALTGLASAQDQKDAHEAGVDMYLVKPVKFADIKRVFGGK
jgi:CheY-like chemotaxis protein